MTYQHLKKQEQAFRQLVPRPTFTLPRVVIIVQIAATHNRTKMLQAGLPPTATANTFVIISSPVTLLSCCSGNYHSSLKLYVAHVRRRLRIKVRLI